VLIKVSCLYCVTVQIPSTALSASQGCQDSTTLFHLSSHLSILLHHRESRYFITFIFGSGLAVSKHLSSVSNRPDSLYLMSHFLSFYLHVRPNVFITCRRYTTYSESYIIIIVLLPHLHAHLPFCRSCQCLWKAFVKTYCEYIALLLQMM
jgi:hypothetical protein